MIAKLGSITFFGNSLLNYAVSIGIILGGIAVVSIVRSILKKRKAGPGKKDAEQSTSNIVMLVQRVIIPLLYLLVIYSGIMHLTMPQFVEKTLRTVFTAAFTVVAINILIAFLNSVVRHLILDKSRDDAQQRSFGAVWPIAQALIWSIGIIFLLENIGFKITTLVAGLGVGGVAVALAGQALLKDVFGYFTILLDKPFELGDSIAVGESAGTVEHIGLKTTRIRSLEGELLILTNTALTDSRVHNYKNMARRRVQFGIAVVYQTRRELLESIPGIIEAAIKSTSQTSFDRAHFASFGNIGFVFEAVYYVENPDYNLYMDRQQEINLRIVRSFEEKGILPACQALPRAPHTSA